jgi:hypothetical protein
MLPVLMLLAVYSTTPIASGLSTEGRQFSQDKFDSPKQDKSKARQKSNKQRKTQKVKQKQYKANKLSQKQYKRNTAQKRNTHRVNHRYSPFNLGTSIIFGNAHFRFNQGVFYRKMAHGYTPTHPPVGLRIKHLPKNHKRIFSRNKAYFLAYGIYYAADSNGYIVVDEPNFSSQPANSIYKLGEHYNEVPAGADSVVINSQQYFKYNSIYFLPQINGEQIQYLALKLD